ncbi:hypothetical protein JMJ35_003406 [Cladonia borealis]|uniref:DUF7053 domain-containing protein n=1 Tax=Cladonia borealis TaxID=184061 RepID=A0AA39R4J6_9LECA|nr:hypothetical protein JMJ35_003406 [Cladonia borealis]
MSKRTTFTTVTALPAGISRQTVLETLHDHFAMIDLNPLVTERHPIKPPRDATAEEFHCKWYAVTDKVNYVPGLYSGSVTFNGCFHDLPDGLQTHIYAPMGLNMKGRWTVGGTLPGEPIQPVEMGLGVPKQGLWLREDVDMKCNFAMVKFVKGTTKKAHGALVQRLVERSQLIEAQVHNNDLAAQLSLRESYPPDYPSQITSSYENTTYPPANTTYSSPTSPPLGSSYSDRHSYTDRNSVASQGTAYGSENQNHFNAIVPDPRSPYVAPLRPKAHDQFPNWAPRAPSPPHFAVELPGHESKGSKELDSTIRYA